MRSVFFFLCFTTSVTHTHSDTQPHTGRCGTFSVVSLLSKTQIFFPNNKNSFEEIFEKNKKIVRMLLRHQINYCLLSKWIIRKKCQSWMDDWETLWPVFFDWPKWNEKKKTQEEKIKKNQAGIFKFLLFFKNKKVGENLCVCVVQELNSYSLLKTEWNTHTERKREQGRGGRLPTAQF